ncbi:unnamed protein product [Choristocarpus tenellus]
MKIRLWKRQEEDMGLDNAKRYLHVTEDALIFEIEGQNECLVIARGPESASSARVSMRTKKSIVGMIPGSPGYVSTISIDGIFGVYDLLSGPFIAVIRRSKLRYHNTMLGIEFRQISKVRLIPVLREPRDLDEGQSREEARCAMGVREWRMGGWAWRYGVYRSRPLPPCFVLNVKTVALFLWIQGVSISWVRWLLLFVGIMYCTSLEGVHLIGFVTFP